ADVIVVGAGLAGLTSAAVLARAGHRVTVCESAPVIGGRARSTGHDGYQLNLGPRALYDGPLARLLRSLRLPVSGGVVTTSRTHTLYEGELRPGFASAPSLLRNGMLSVRDRAELAALLGTGRPRRGLAGVSAAEWLAGRLSSERARTAAFALLRMSTYAGHAGTISADSVAAQLQLVRRGVRYVHGGWQSIVDALRADVLAHGAIVRTATRVAAVGDGPAVTLADGATLSARAVVLAGLSPRQAADLLGSPEPAGAVLHTACLDIALSYLPRPAHSLIYGMDEPVYLAVHSRSARVAPAGGAVLHLARYDDGRQPAAATIRAGFEQLLDRCQAGWRSAVVHQRFLPRMTTMWSLPTAATGGLAARPAVAVPDRPGVFLAGDWVGPNGLLADAAVGSALLAAAAVRSLLSRH
ncbi:MAG TPA: FAD-dependent oxidoreductase, partial [Pseudonocardiaceae bacterium]